MTPRQWQIVLATLLVGSAVLLQNVVFARVPLPGATASLILAVVIAVGMSGGQTFGAVAGFGAGLAMDLLPPASGTVGATALAFLVTGALAGRVRDPRGLAPAQLAGILAGLAALAGFVQLGLAVALGDSDLAVLPSLTELVAYCMYVVVLGLILVPLVSAVLRRVGSGHRTRRPRISAHR